MLPYVLRRRKPARALQAAVALPLYLSIRAFLAEWRIVKSYRKPLTASYSWQQGTLGRLEKDGFSDCAIHRILIDHFAQGSSENENKYTVVKSILYSTADR